MSDLIDRQEAINVIERMRAYIGHNMERAVGAAFIEILDDVGEDIGRLPSAQPDIIRCKDCKHHWTHKCMDSMPIERCDLEQTFYDAEVDYCSLAERRQHEVR